MYLAGGTSLSTVHGTLTRTDQAAPDAGGLAYVEKIADGGFMVGNLSPTPATMTVSLNCSGGSASIPLAANSVQPL